LADARSFSTSSRHFALALAAKYGLDLAVVEPRDLPRLERERADVVVDWDGMPADY
jgi:hypothetical protein